MKFSEIPQLFRANYKVNVPWKQLNHWIDSHTEDFNVDLDPDFQRGHVWTEEQRIAYLEYILAGGSYGRELRWNSPNWMNWRNKTSFQPLVLVDGKQRLTSVLKFLNNEVRVYGLLYEKFEDKLCSHSHDFIMFVNNLKTRKEVLEWYLQINRGGVIHTKEEIQKVEELLRNEAG